MESRIAFEPASIAANWTGAAKFLGPEMREGARGMILRTPDAEMRGNALAKDAVYLGNASFAIHFQKIMALREVFEFALHHGLITNERLKEVVRKGHVAPGFPVADGMGLLEFAIEGCLGTHVEPEG